MVTADNPSITHLRAFSPFDQMSDAALALIKQHYNVTNYPLATTLLTPATDVVDRLYVLLEGEIEGREPEHGEAIWTLMPGDLFPVGALLSDRPVSNDYVITQSARCLELPLAIFQELMHSSTEFADFCSRRIAHLLQVSLTQQQTRSAQDLVSQNNLNIPLKDLIQNTLQCRTNSSIRAALQVMAETQHRSIAIVDEAEQPVGILTLRDVLHRITLPQLDIEQAVKDAMTPSPYSLTGDTPGFEAAATMAGHGIGHICVTDEQHRFLGIVSERDLFSLQQIGLANISRKIRQTDNISLLALMHDNIEQLLVQLQAQGIAVEQLTTLITHLNDLITQRIIHLCLKEFPDLDGQFSWLSFGSEGRMEQTLVTDQDNGMIFHAIDLKSAEQQRHRLLPLARRINEALDRCGYPLCKGNIMASNPECCLSLDEWQHRFTQWIKQGAPEHLLKASIFFDFRVLYGDEKIASSLREQLLQLSQHESRFLRMMASNALRNRPPLGLWRDFNTHKNSDGRQTIDLKINAITPIVDAARIFALSNKIKYSNTLKRLDAIADIGQLNKNDVENWKQAWHFIQLIRTRNQQQALLNHQTANNLLLIDSLSSLEQRILKESLRQVAKIQRKLSMDYSF